MANQSKIGFDNASAAHFYKQLIDDFTPITRLQNNCLSPLKRTVIYPVFGKEKASKSASFFGAILLLFAPFLQ